MSEFCGFDQESDTFRMWEATLPPMTLNFATRLPWRRVTGVGDASHKSKGVTALVAGLHGTSTLKYNETVGNASIILFSSRLVSLRKVSVKSNTAASKSPASPLYLIRFLGLVLACGLSAAGCSSGPSRVRPPSINASGAASEAMELYDKDGDGFIAGSELDAVPGVKAAMETIDADKDGKATEEEIAARIEAWQASKIGVMAVKANFTLDGRPLSGAQITFEPESFLGQDIKAATGEASGGVAMVSIPKEQRPAKDTPPGLQLGLYRVRVSKKANGQETIPAKYNTETTLGQQVAPDDPAVAGQKMRFELTTK
jgi:hypothetical protein